jgi:Skp family chaperone for outer membrane proteins
MKLERTSARVGLTILALVAVVSIAANWGGGAAPQQGTVRLAFVSSNLILQQTPGYQQAESTLEAESNSYRQELQALQRQLDSAINQFNQQSIMLSPSARQEQQQDLSQRSEQFQQRTNELQQRITQRQRELVAPLEDRIQRVIDGLRAERNLQLIFDAAAPGNNIISADPALDLTQVVITRLNTGSQ